MTRKEETKIKELIENYKDFNHEYFEENPKHEAYYLIDNNILTIGIEDENGNAKTGYDEEYVFIEGFVPKIEKESHGYYAECEELQGCFTQADSYLEIIEKIKAAMKLHIQDRKPKNNSIINSLKRLERVGSETSMCTLKLKKACEEVAKRILDNVRGLVFCSQDYPMEKISGKLYYVAFSESFLAWDFDGQLGYMNEHQYSLMPENNFVLREIALEFAQAISEGLFEKVINWIEKKKAENEEAIKKLEEAK